MLFQNDFGYSHFPELVDMATIGTGLGMLLSTIGFVNNQGSYWDSTQWEYAPKPFLDSQSVAYANALTAWIRNETNPRWAEDHSTEVKSPMKKSLKYLFKTDDSFFKNSPEHLNRLDQTQQQWLTIARESGMSSQVISIRHLELDGELEQQQEELLVKTLRSGETAIVLNSIATVERSNCQSEEIANELRFLTEHRDEQVRAKTLCALARLNKLDETSISEAVKALESGTRYVVFAGIFAVASCDTASEKTLPAVNKAFVRALQSCDYEFIGLFAAAYHRWFDDPESHLKNLLQDNYPDYIDMAVEALQSVRSEMVALEN